MDKNLSHIPMIGRNPHVVIVGAGAMGCYFGGMLAKNNHHVSFVDVDEKAIIHIKNHGITIDSNNNIFNVPVDIRKAEEVKDLADVIIIFTKAQHIMKAMSSIKHIIKSTTIVMSLQNGLGNLDEISNFIDKDKIAIGTTLVPSILTDFGQVYSYGPSSSNIMDANLKCPEWLSSLVEILNGSGLNTNIDVDIYTTIWNKVTFNATINSLCAIYGCPNGGLNVSSFDDMALAIINEIKLVAKKYDIELCGQTIFNTIKMAVKEHPLHKPSMLQDIEKGIETEVRNINYSIVKAAKAKGVNAPINEMLTFLVEMKEQLNTFKFK